MFFEWFVKNNQEWVQNMRDTLHHEDSEPNLSLSPYHLEGDVWSHTCMVYTQAKVKYPEDYLNLEIAVVLHDIGKVNCFTIEEKDGRKIKRFSNHEGRSMFDSYGLIKQFAKDNPTVCMTEERIEMILTAIALHGRLYTDGFKMENLGVLPYETRNLLLGLISCDVPGRVVSSDKDRKLTVSDRVYNEVLCLPEPKVNNSSAPKLVLLVGVPGSGKSTYVEEHMKGYTIVSRDALIMEAADPRLSYSEAWREADHQEIDRKLMTIFSTALKNGEDIVIDMTNMTKKGRRKFIIPARQKNYYISAIVFLVRTEDAYINRCLLSKKFVPWHAIVGMMNRFTFPLADEVDVLEFHHYTD